MVIEYQIKRFDLVRAYFYNLQHTKRTRLIVLGGAILFFAYSLFLRYRIYGRLVLYDFILSVLITIGLILAVPLFFFITAKTQKRTMSIRPEGIATKIGSKEGKILWKEVDRIATTEDRIIITGKKANTFSIPASAFTSSKQRQSFIDLATQYHFDANREEVDHL